MQAQVIYNGSGYQEELDFARLSRGLDQVRGLMKDGVPRTLREISDATGVFETTASAHLSKLRREGWVVAKSRRGDPKRGMWQYWKAGVLP